MSERRPRPVGGFTLLEVVLAMTALALVAAVCYGAFHLAIRAVERGEVAVVTAQRTRVAAEVLNRQIKSIVAYAVRNADEDVYPYFVGTATSMAFVTANGLRGGGRLTRVVYQVVDDPPRLVMAETEMFSPDQLGRESGEVSLEHTTVLLDGFRGLKFEYLMNDGVDTEWLPSWDGQEEETLPGAIRVLVDGLPGMDVDGQGQPLPWGQEKPVMLALYGENLGEVDEEDLAELGYEYDEESDRPPSRDWDPKEPPGDEDEFDEDDEDDE